MRRAAWAYLLLLGCGASPDDLFVLGGLTTDVSGGALDGVPVTLWRDFGGQCGLGALLRQAGSADGGLFSWDLARVEVQSLSERRRAVCLRVEAALDSGTVAFVDLFSLPNQLQLPPFRDWRPRLTLDAGLPAFEPLMPRESALLECTEKFLAREELIYGLVASGPQGPYWQQTDRTVWYDGGRPQYGEAPLRLQPELLEDLPLEVELGARRVGCVEAAARGPFAADLAYQLATRWRTADRVRVQGTLVPVSRGAACDVAAPCPLTDGDPRPVDFDLDGGYRKRFRFTLARPAAVRRVLLRGGLTDLGQLSGAQLTVRAGADAVTVSLPPQPATLDELTVRRGDFAQRLWLDVRLPRALDAGTVVQLELGRRVLSLAEVSLFE